MTEQTFWIVLALHPVAFVVMVAIIEVLARLGYLYHDSNEAHLAGRHNWTRHELLAWRESER